MAKILIIDDDKGMNLTLSGMVKRIGHEATSIFSLREWEKATARESFDIVFLDVMLPDGNGLDLLPKIEELPNKPEVIIITSRGDPDGAELAIKNGAWDYIQKPSSLKQMTLPLLRALQYREERNSKGRAIPLNRERIIGNSPQIKKCLSLLAQAATSEENVLIMGETGTGKELFAKTIHENSRRRSGNYVVVECAGLANTLVGSILFGHEKGAFTGADRDQIGLIKQADGGSLFLDEVGELSSSNQKAFLRVLQEHRFRPIGGKQEIKSDFRLIAATNKNLDLSVKNGIFRDDLLFRLKSLVIELPPLRNRPEDIEEIAINYTSKLSKRYENGMKGFSPEFFENLIRYPWPGNIRELISAVERAYINSNKEVTLFPKHLPTHIRVHLARESVNKNAQVKPFPIWNSNSKKSLSTYEEYLEESKRNYFQALITLTGGDMMDACGISGLSRSSIYEHIKKYKIPKSK